jgi:hypothetical protein
MPSRGKLQASISSKEALSRSNTYILILKQRETLRQLVCLLRALLTNLGGQDQPVDATKYQRD